MPFLEVIAGVIMVAGSFFTLIGSLGLLQPHLGGGRFELHAHHRLGGGRRVALPLEQLQRGFEEVVLDHPPRDFQPLVRRVDHAGQRPQVLLGPAVADDEERAVILPLVELGEASQHRRKRAEVVQSAAGDD